MKKKRYLYMYYPGTKVRYGLFEIKGRARRVGIYQETNEPILEIEVAKEIICCENLRCINERYRPHNKNKTRWDNVKLIPGEKVYISYISSMDTIMEFDSEDSAMLYYNLTYGVSL